MSDEPTTLETAKTGLGGQTPLEWRVSPDGKSATYGGKVYLSQNRVATLGLGLPINVRASLKEGMLPNGEAADVIRDSQSRALFFNKDLIDRLQRRFAYADTGDSLGPCKVHNGPWLHGLRYDLPRSENHLRGVSQVRRDLARDDHQLSLDLSKWLETGIGPGGVRVRKIRDTITGDELITLRTLHEVYDVLTP